MNSSELNHLYNEAESVHGSLFAEQRSNVLLVAGNHYNKSGSRYWNKIRSTENLSKTQKLRLTKNHLQRITKSYQNNLLSMTNSTSIAPKNDGEIQDRKAAELNDAVWSDIKIKHKWKSIRRKMASDFIDIGELWMKISYDYSLGKFLGYEPIVNDYGEYEIDEDGKPKANAKFSGDLVFERFHGFNVLTDPEARSWEEARWVIFRKMKSIKDLRKLFADDEEKLKNIKDCSNSTYKLFDGQNGSYSDGKGLVMVREYYFRPCPDLPNGYYYIATEAGVLFEGELPLGIFPVIHKGFDELSTSARSISIIKQLRPYTAEINRAASKVAEHQITLGDDKIVTQSGVSISAGGTAHGVKHIKVNGPAPTILAGRTGEQYLGYINSQIAEMYQISNLQDDYEKESGQLDAYTLLFRSLKSKKKFLIYGEKFQEAEEEATELSLRLKKAYCSEEELIPIVGKTEYVNIAEFKNTTDLNYQIKFEEQSEDAESKMGRQLSMNHILQYAGNSLEASDLGKLIRTMPYVNKEELFSDLTIDYDNANNDILALDRGQASPANIHDNHEYIIKRVVHRMKQADFDQLDPQIQQAYHFKKQAHEQAYAQQQEQIQRAKDGFIPSGGHLVTVDFYVPKPGDPTKTQRAKLPYEALDYLIKALEAQGSSQDAMEQQDPQVQAELAQMLMMQAQQQESLPAQSSVVGI